ncbi:hypothetical protein FACS1894111_06700 [Clostridia bacterium]|nr:hypothetical protein FACS1894111_06700 [Clostridia bacterium]
MMLTYRIFITLTSILLVIFFLFVAANIMQTVWNDYQTNPYAGSLVPISEDNQTLIAQTDSYLPMGIAHYVAYVGNTEDQSVGAMIEEWCVYKKCALLKSSSVSNSLWHKPNPPDMVLLDSNYLTLPEDISIIQDWANQGIGIVFLNLPKESVLADSKELQDLLGISSIKAANQSLTGVEIYEGFLLGGHQIYDSTDPNNKDRSDLDLNVPWYLLSGGTKAYMVGLLSDKTVKNEELPALVWDHPVANTRVFAVNGDYMNDVTGFGFLDGMMTEMQSYSIYPVVNAQSLVFANCPVLADENDTYMQATYGQSARTMFRDVIWPSMIALSQKSAMKITCLLTPKLDYTDKTVPVGADLSSYISLFNKYQAGTGLSGMRDSGTSLKQKIDQDSLFLKQYMPEYDYFAMYLEDPKEWSGVADENLLKSIRTIADNYSGESKLLSYLTENVTLQQGIDTGFTHSFKDDLRLRSVESSLAYSHILVDMKPLVFPASAEDRWEKLSPALAANIVTYWKPFSQFGQTDLSESDNRIREFLALNYSQYRNQNTIHLGITGKFAGEAYFILRTHEEEIASITGATYLPIEEDAYLMQATEENVTITLEPKQVLYYVE